MHSPVICPIVPSTSAWPAWPINTISRPWRAYRRPSLCTLATSGQVASITGNPRARGSCSTLFDHPVRRKDRHRAMPAPRPAHRRTRRRACRRSLDDVAVVHDFVTDVDGRTELLQGPLHDLDCPLNARAKAARLGQDRRESFRSSTVPQHVPPEPESLLARGRKLQTARYRTSRSWPGQCWLGDRMDRCARMATAGKDHAAAAAYVKLLHNTTWRNAAVCSVGHSVNAGCAAPGRFIGSVARISRLGSDANSRQNRGWNQTEGV